MLDKFGIKQDQLATIERTLEAVKNNDNINCAYNKAIMSHLEVKNLSAAVLSDDSKSIIKKHSSSITNIFTKAADIVKGIAHYPLKHPVKTLFLVASAAAMLSGVVIPLDTIAQATSLVSNILTGGGMWGSALTSTKALAMLTSGASSSSIVGTWAFVDTAVLLGVPLMAFKLVEFVHSKLFRK